MKPEEHESRFMNNVNECCKLEFPPTYIVSEEHFLSELCEQEIDAAGDRLFLKILHKHGLSFWKGFHSAEKEYYEVIEKKGLL